MKRDLDLIREILLRVESDDDIAVDCPQQKLAMHLLLIQENHFLSGVVVQEAFNGPPVIQQLTAYVRLTSAGHDFLDTIRDRSTWDKTKEKIATVGGGVTLAMVQQIATTILKAKLGLG